MKRTNTRLIALIYLFTTFIFTHPANAQNWLTQTIPASNAGFNMKIVDVMDGITPFGLGSDMSIYYLNGGGNWQLYSTYPAGSGATCIHASDIDTVWISTYDFADSARLFRTVNHGVNWDTIQTVGLHCDFFHFFDAEYAVSFSDPIDSVFIVYTTSNGGNSWQNVTSIPQRIAGENCMDGHQYVFGNNIWVPTTKGRILMSNDKGQNWTASVIDTFNFPITNRVAFYSALEGIAVRYDETGSTPLAIYRSHNGGISWDTIPFTGTVCQSFYGGLFIVPGTSVIISNGNSTPVKGSTFSIDSGMTWNIIDTLNGYGGVDGLNWTALWSGQAQPSVGVGGIAKWDSTALFIPTVLYDKDFMIYPNPIRGDFAMVTFTQRGKSRFTISLMDMSGKIISSKIKIADEGRNIIPIGVRNVDAGIYLVELKNEIGRVCKKVVITDSSQR